jgi:hypothetical protein
MYLLNYVKISFNSKACQRSAWVQGCALSCHASPQKKPSLVHWDNLYLYKLICHLNKYKNLLIVWKMWHLVISDSKRFLYKICQLGRVVGDQTFKCSGQARSGGSTVLFLVSRQNLNSSSWSIWHTKNRENWIRNEKVTALQSKGGQELQKQTTEHYKGLFSNI